MEKKLAPIVVFAYNRADRLSDTLTALSQNYLAKDSEVFIYIDAAKNEEEKGKVSAVEDCANDFKEKNVFKTVHIFPNKEHKGLAKSCIACVTEVINQYGKVIALDDDLITSKDFLNYMNDCLEFYASQKNIWSVGGYCPKTYGLAMKLYPSELFLGYRSSSWGWATWKDRWELVDWDMKTYEEFRKDKRKVKRFKRGGRDLIKILDLQMNGKISSWSIRWHYAAFQNNMLSIYPKHSKVKNIGLDGSGTHCSAEQQEACNVEAEERTYKLKKLSKNYLLLECLDSCFSENIRYRLRRKISRFFRRLRGGN